MPSNILHLSVIEFCIKSLTRAALGFAALTFLWFSCLPSIASQEVIESAPSQLVNVLVLGDSLSAAYNIPVERGWVSLLQRRVAEEFSNVSVVNASVSGETAANAVSRLPLLIDEYTPDIVVIELGGNDGLRGFPLEKIEQSLQTLIEIAKSSGAYVVLTGVKLNPNYGPKFNDLFFKMFARLAQENGTGLVPFILKDIGDDAKKMQEDAIHPTANAQNEVLENMWPQINLAIERRLQSL